MPRWLSVPLWFIALLACYIVISCGWHAALYNDWVGPLPDSSLSSASFNPFEEDDYPVAVPEQMLNGINQILYDFPGRFRRIDSPLGFSKSSKGKHYFDTNDSYLDFVTAHLRALGEPSLFEREPSDENTYFRFTFVPTSNHPQCFRLTSNSEGKNELVSLQSYGVGGLDTGGIRQRLISLLDPANAEALIAESNDELFWRRISKHDKYYLGPPDSSTWVFERSSPTGYQMVWIKNSFLDCTGIPDLVEQLMTGRYRLSKDHSNLGRRLIEQANFNSSFGVEYNSSELPPRNPFE